MMTERWLETVSDAEVDAIARSFFAEYVAALNSGAWSWLEAHCIGSGHRESWARYMARASSSVPLEVIRVTGVAQRKTGWRGAPAIAATIDYEMMTVRTAAGKGVFRLRILSGGRIVALSRVA